MSQFIINAFLNCWLVIACILYVAIVWQAYRPSARTAMERHALIPFRNEGEGR